RILSRRDPRRAHRGRDHQPHVDGESRICLRDALRRDDFGAGAAAARTARPAGPRMSRRVPGLAEIATAACLIAAPFVLPYLGAAPNTVNRILVWGLFG